MPVLRQKCISNLHDENEVISFSWLLHIVHVVFQSSFCVFVGSIYTLLST